MTSNGSGEVNQSQNQGKKAQNGVSRRKCGGLMSHMVNRKPNRSIHSMGLKRLRSVDPAAGMKSISFFPVATFIVIAEVSKNVN